MIFFKLIVASACLVSSFGQIQASDCAKRLVSGPVKAMHNIINIPTIAIESKSASPISNTSALSSPGRRSAAALTYSEGDFDEEVASLLGAVSIVDEIPQIVKPVVAIRANAFARAAGGAGGPSDLSIDELFEHFGTYKKPKFIDTADMFFAGADGADSDSWKGSSRSMQIGDEEFRVPRDLLKENFEKSSFLEISQIVNPHALLKFLVIAQVPDSSDVLSSVTSGYGVEPFLKVASSVLDPKTLKLSRFYANYQSKVLDKVNGVPFDLTVEFRTGLKDCHTKLVLKKAGLKRAVEALE